MKKTLLAIAFATVAQVSAWAQNTHTFTQTTGTYTDLVSPTAISAAGWDEDDYTVTLGFPFALGGTTFTDVDLSANGLLFFIAGQDVKVVSGLMADMMDRSIAASPSTISYLVSGTAGSRIGKIQFKNAGFYDDASSTSTNFVPFANDFINFQIWLYEGSNKIEMHYGTSAVPDAATIFDPNTGSPVIVITDVTATSSTTEVYTGVSLQGTAATPTLNPLNASGSFPSLTTIPANGTIYAFMPATTTGISKDQLATAVALFPNPATNVINFKGLADLKVSAPVTVSDVTGKVLLTETLGANQQLNISSLPKGSYMVKILTDKGQVVKHVVKQ
jgi:hypothetical protein